MAWPDVRYEIGIEFASLQPTAWGIIEQAFELSHPANWGLMKGRRRDAYEAQVERRWRADLDAKVAADWPEVRAATKIKMMRAAKRNQQRRALAAVDLKRWQKRFGADRDRCHGETQRQHRCGRHAVSDTRFCALHLRGRTVADPGYQGQGI